MKIYISSLFVLFSIVGLCQEKSLFDQANVEAKTCYANSDFQCAKTKFEEALQWIQPEDSLTNMAITFNNLSVVCRKLGQYNESITFSQKSFDVYTAIENDSLLAQSNYNYGIALKSLENYDLAIDKFSVALLFFEAKNLKKEMLKVYISLGNLYRDKKDYELSEEYLLMALEVSDSLKNRKEKSRIFHNLGMLYNSSGQSDQANYYLFEARQIKIEIGMSLASNSAQIGQHYLNKNELDSAEHYLKLSLSERELSRNRSKLVTARWHMGDLYIKKQNYQLADQYLNLAFQIADSMQLSGSKAKIIQSQIEVDKALNRSEGLVSKYETLLYLNEETWGVAEQNATARFNVKYQTFQKDQEILRKDNQLVLEQLENERLATRNLLLLIGFVFTLSIIIGFYWFYTRLKKSKAVIEQKNAELEDKNILVDSLHRELSHRTKNYFQMFIGILKYDRRLVEDSKLKGMITRYISRATAMTEIHRYLHSEKTITGTVKLNLYLSNLLNVIDQALNIKANKIKIEETFESIKYDYDMALRLGLAMNEIISNALEHGFKDQKEGLIQLEMKTNNSGLTLKIKDNGHGFNAASKIMDDPTKGTGIIKNILSSVNGYFQYHDQTEGTLAIISIPNKKVNH